MIARMWHGQVPQEHAEAFYQHLLDTGVAEYQTIPGHQDTCVLRRDEQQWARFTVLSFWDSLASLSRYTGDDLEKAVLYSGDEQFGLVPDLYVHHYRVLFSSSC